MNNNFNIKLNLPILKESNESINIKKEIINEFQIFEEIIQNLQINEIKKKIKKN